MAETAESTTNDLVKWIRSVLPDVPAIARPLGARERTSGIDVRLIAASPRPTARSAEPPAILDLDYLVTVQMADAEAERQALVELLFAAMDWHECEVVSGKDIAQLCAQLGFPAATGFILRRPLVRERDVRAAKRVRADIQPTMVEIETQGLHQFQADLLLDIDWKRPFGHERRRARRLALDDGGDGAGQETAERIEQAIDFHRAAARLIFVEQRLVRRFAEFRRIFPEDDGG